MYLLEILYLFIVYYQEIRVKVYLLNKKLLFLKYKICVFILLNLITQVIQ